MCVTDTEPVERLTGGIGSPVTANMEKSFEVIGPDRRRGGSQRDAGKYFFHDPLFNAMETTVSVETALVNDVAKHH